ncbi:hypothetical protein KC950_01080 [Candidatus Saccharibacteria bacterium]|nr:hypothetical protein [Candidatus Saccharibacteria bacterium]
MAKRVIHKKPKNKETWIDKAVLIAAIGYPLMTIPQIIKIYESQSAEDLSLLSFGFYMLFEFLFFIYGLKHKLPPIIITGLLWFAMYILVIIGILLYG